MTVPAGDIRRIVSISQANLARDTRLKENILPWQQCRPDLPYSEKQKEFFRCVQGDAESKEILLIPGHNAAASV